MAYGWKTTELDEVGEFWFLTEVKKILIGNGIIQQSETVKGIKIEWELGQGIEIKVLVPESD